MLTLVRNTGTDREGGSHATGTIARGYASQQC